ncbi:hypothetical protein DDE18_10025 [Nocardioides gansuensis]|uniref:Integral membrane protein n=1 Tax=Nocardioides gansuensis TaxID=2138300 RepID=A0A2T8FAI7_9ACTN|nr:hypothetical protein [Nocardioides gansuensis]PVG82695.1 hypothetical protein DDE18_10025 [Nocardioides gansuensis]
MTDRLAPPEAEAWFLAHGLPYFVDPIREKVGHRLSRPRLLLVALVGLAVAVPAGIAAGWWLGLPSVGIATGVTVLLLVAALYAARALRADLIAGWALRRTFASLGLLFPLATRALPMLLLFVTFLFINTEVWMVASSLDGGVLWGAVMLFAAMACGFLVVRLVEELDQLDDEVGRAELGPRADVVGLQKANLVLVLLITQAVQVLLLALAVFGFFLVFGAVAMKDEVVEAWIGVPPTYPWGVGPVSRELVQVSTFLAGFSGLYFAVYAVTDQHYRRQFFSEVLGELEQALRVRVGYLLDRD